LTFLIHSLVLNYEKILASQVGISKDCLYEVKSGENGIRRILKVRSAGHPASTGLTGHAGLADGSFTKLIISELVAVMDNKDKSVFCGKGFKGSRIRGAK